MRENMPTVIRLGLFLFVETWLTIWTPAVLGQTASTKLDAQATLSNVENQKTHPEDRRHNFWDQENGWLFASIGASRTLDYFSTLNMRRRGRQEILLTNAVVDNHAAFAAIEVSGVGASIGASYLFHRYGHHKLERWTSLVHFGVTTGGTVRNYCLKTAHPATAAATP
jgi:hypothetical protein